MRALHEDYRKGTVASSEQLMVAIPAWINNLGLEWLYELVLQMEASFKSHSNR